MTTELERQAPLLRVLDGFPKDLVPSGVLPNLARYCAELDALGRRAVNSRRSIVDQETLRTMLLWCLTNAAADRVLDVLASLPSSALSTAAEITAPLDNADWCRLAEGVAVFDVSPHMTFHDLALARAHTPALVLEAVRQRFPSLEPELLNPHGLPPRLAALCQDGSALEAVITESARQLGWWCALATVLLLPASAIAMEPAAPSPTKSTLNVWPLVMFPLAAGLGGWTLTVIGSIVLSPR